MVYLEETISDGHGQYLQRWECAPPSEGAKYRVVEERWLDLYGVRVISQIELV